MSGCILTGFLQPEEFIFYANNDRSWKLLIFKDPNASTAGGGI